MPFRLGHGILTEGEGSVLKYDKPPCSNQLSLTDLRARKRFNFISNTSCLKEEVNCTKPSRSVSVPCCEETCHRPDVGDAHSAKDTSTMMDTDKVPPKSSNSILLSSRKSEKFSKIPFVDK